MRTKEMEYLLKSDIDFIYNGKGAAFCPLEKYVVGFAGQPNEFKTLKEAINAKVFDGKSLLEIWDEISPQFI